MLQSLLCISCIVFHLLLLLGAPTRGAVIETDITPEMAVMGCTVRISGRIDRGDAAALAEVLSVSPRYEDFGDRLNFSPAYRFGFPFATHRLCLNSQGGSFLEALEIAVSLGGYVDQANNPGIPTAVASGDSCLSACALIFMAGRYAWEPSVESYWEYDRVLHPAGRLGFHAPFLPLDERSYDYRDAREIQRINALAVSELMSAIERGALQMTPALIANMFSVSFSDLVFVEDLGTASLYNISVAPVPYSLVLDQPMEAVLTNVCDHGARMLGGYIRLSRDSDIAWEVSLAEIENRREFAIRGISSDAFLADNLATIPGSVAETSAAEFRYRCALPAGTIPDRDVEAFSPQEFLRTSFRDSPNMQYSRFFSVFDNNEAFRPGGAHSIVRFPQTLGGDLTPRGEFSHHALPAEMRLIDLLGAWDVDPLHRNCLADEEELRIVRVNEFATLRRWPGFDAEVLSEVPLGARVTVRGGFSMRGEEDRVQACSAACRGRPISSIQISECFRDNTIWVPVDHGGESGWVAGRYLSAY